MSMSAILFSLSSPLRHFIQQWSHLIAKSFVSFDFLCCQNNLCFFLTSQLGYLVLLHSWDVLFGSVVVIHSRIEFHSLWLAFVCVHCYQTTFLLFLYICVSHRLGMRFGYNKSIRGTWIWGRICLLLCGWLLKQWLSLWILDMILYSLLVWSSYWLLYFSILIPCWSCSISEAC